MNFRARPTDTVEYSTRAPVNLSAWRRHVCRQFGRMILCLPITFAVSVLAYDIEQLQQQLPARFGPTQVGLLRDWQKIVGEAKSLSEKDKLKKIDEFINARIEFDDDMAIWNQSDYWATPLETIGQGKGDCEDFAILKYFSLKEAGIPVAKLRLVYVKTKLNGPNGPYVQAHMILAYYATPNDEPLILDNLVTESKLASQRNDLQPVFSFNSEAIWSGNAGKGSGGTEQLSRWQDLLRRAAAEGFD